MLIRVIIKNLYSFNDYTEINLLPGNVKRLDSHVYQGKIKLLKLNTIYGANGSGKSNLIKCIAILKQLVEEGTINNDIITQTFKFNPDSNKQDVYLGIEFIENTIPYYYGITINQGMIVSEELSISGVGEKEDELLFERKQDQKDRAISLKFSENISKNKEINQFPAFIKTELQQTGKPLLFYIRNQHHAEFAKMKAAYNWFAYRLNILHPSSKPANLQLVLESNPEFKKFAHEVFKAFNTGVKEIVVRTMSLEEYFGEDNKQNVDIIIAKLKGSKDKILSWDTGLQSVTFIYEDDRPVAKVIYLTHLEDDGKVHFELSSESDGTRRLLDFIPAFYNSIYEEQVFIIDEIERSIHPILIKELIKKFSLDEKTNGQLIFSTHESNLLDQQIFRTDEIWFAEKDLLGQTRFSALSDFREHHTKDIQKGYLNGRYGGIPKPSPSY